MSAHLVVASKRRPGNVTKWRLQSPLAHFSDIHCIVFHGVVWLCYGLAFWLFLHPANAGITGPFTMAAFVGGAALLLGWISGVDVGVNFHNHCHRPIFRSRLANLWFGRLWTISGGWPAYFWSYAHIAVHHKQLLEEADWTLPRRRPNGEWENFYTYCLMHWPWRYVSHLFQDFRPSRCGRATNRRALKELLIFALIWSIPFWIDFNMALALWLLPQWIANVVVMGPGMYVQHAGREKPNDDHIYRHSNTFVSRLFNHIMFNIGFHAEHHTYPAIHWSELPELHEQIKNDLIEDGAHVVPFGYYHGTYLLARQRPEFENQHPDYIRNSCLATPVEEKLA